MTTLRDQIMAEMIIQNLRAIIGATLATADLIQDDPANAINQFNTLKPFIEERLNNSSKGILDASN